MPVVIVRTSRLFYCTAVRPWCWPKPWARWRGYLCTEGSRRSSGLG